MRENNTEGEKWNKKEELVTEDRVIEEMRFPVLGCVLARQIEETESEEGVVPLSVEIEQCLTPL